MSMKSRVLKEAIEKGKVQKLSEEIEYLRFRKDFSGVSRGTVICNDRVIWGFPHITRIFTLEAGIKRNIETGEIYVEEKIDGYNLRIAKIQGKIYAFSRGGFLDAFSTEKARGLGLDRFFKAHPRHILCGEMIGNTPYTEPAHGYDVKLLVFDIMKEDGSLLPCAKRRDVLEKHSIGQVPLLGRFKSDDMNSVKRIALSLNKSRKEGMVIKSSDRKSIVKYVTPWADIDDIANASRAFFDFPPGFFYQRVFRSSMFIKDFGLDREEYSERLGKAFYLGLVESLKEASGGDDISRKHEILVNDPAVWDEIKGHMSKEVKIEEVSRTEEDGRLRIRFLKRYRKTSRNLRGFLKGKGVTD